HVRETNALADHPTVRILKIALMEIGDMIEFGSRAVAKPQAAEWTKLLHDCLANTGALDGASEKQVRPIERMYSAKPYVYDPLPKRDSRFIDPFNRGVNPESMLYDKEMPGNAKVLMLYFKRLREIDVPEMMASSITRTTGQPSE